MRFSSIAGRFFRANFALPVQLISGSLLDLRKSGRFLVFHRLENVQYAASSRHLPCRFNRAPRNWLFPIQHVTCFHTLA